MKAEIDKCPKCDGPVIVIERSLQHWGGIDCKSISLPSGETNKQSESLLCPKCGATDNIAQSTQGNKYHCFRCDNYWKK